MKPNISEVESHLTRYLPRPFQDSGHASIVRRCTAHSAFRSGENEKQNVGDESDERYFQMGRLVFDRRCLRIICASSQDTTNMLSKMVVMLQSFISTVTMCQPEKEESGEIDKKVLCHIHIISLSHNL